MTAGHALQNGQENRSRLTFHHDYVRTDFQRLSPQFHVGPAGQHDDARMRRGLPEHGDDVDMFRILIEINDDQVGTRLLHQVASGGAGMRLADHLDPWMSIESAMQTHPQERVAAHDHDLDL